MGERGVCLCVCVREREREMVMRESERVGDRERGQGRGRDIFMNESLMHSGYVCVYPRVHICVSVRKVFMSESACACVRVGIFVHVSLCGQFILWVFSIQDTLWQISLFECIVKSITLKEINHQRHEHLAGWKAFSRKKEVERWGVGGGGGGRWVKGTGYKAFIK